MGERAVEGMGVGDVRKGGKMVLGRGDSSWERRVLPFGMNMSYFIFLCFRHFPPVALRFRPFRAPRIATI